MVRNQIDTVDALMAHYVAGSLPEPARVLVAAHLEMQPTNRGIIRDMESLAGEALEQLPPSGIAGRDARLASIFASKAPMDIPVLKQSSTPVGRFPNVLKQFIGFDVDEVPWRTKLPGFKEYNPPDMDDCEISLMWIRPGRKMPSHTHQGVEITLILDGAYNDERARYGTGDISVADDGVVHRPIAENERPCITFSILDAPIKFKGPLTQLIGDLIG